MRSRKTEGKRERKRGVSLGHGNSIKEEPAFLLSSSQKNSGPGPDTLQRASPPNRLPARRTGCHAAALELPVPPNLLGGQQCRLSLGPSRFSPAVSVLCARKAWAQEATAATATNTTAATTAGSAAAAACEDAEGPQHRRVPPCDVFHGSGGPGWTGAGHVPALPPTEGAGRTQRGKPACAFAVLWRPGVDSSAAAAEGKGTPKPRGTVASCKVYFSPFFLSSKWIILVVLFQRQRNGGSNE